ncbi:MAG: hypothetical protein Q7U64_13250 [Desulfocapsaceae bacterium]|nr:hypothetical protein [Desulfocapsaceae bacterium]
MEGSAYAPSIQANEADCDSQFWREQAPTKTCESRGSSGDVNLQGSYMVIFSTPFYVKQPDENNDVLVFGKSPEQRNEDSVNGISRFGGLWRAPSYFNSYLRSARILIDHGVKTNSLDDIGLPIFYMQRHATELLIKRLLSWLYEIAEFRTELGQNCQDIPSNQQKKNFKKSHDLSQLFKDLSKVSEHLGLAKPPSELGEWVMELAKYEKTETWARYNQSETRDHMVIRHVQDEIALPLVDLQRRFEQVILNIEHRLYGEETYENELYDEWLCVARSLGKAG